MGHIELSWLSLVTNFLNSPVETDFDGLALGVNPLWSIPLSSTQAWSSGTHSRLEGL